MFVVLLRFADKSRAAALMEAHKEWIADGFADQVFVLLGNLETGLGGAILAAGASRTDIEARVNEDPFVKEGVVRAEVIEITPSRADPRLAFLVEPRAR
ncbi:MAG TPA: YciI family protein [Vitreimonas sp.]|uniref:YciI family protein n=1 Tax=Vitreimonas sp. TaxID=3069702 RepID=UPI002D3F05B5|nr:YciI family protein [Vitreimonas sp.]HYD86089.1 YciI family protein [Vitreimonas sp.]